MKKIIIGFLVVTGIVIAVYADCTDTTISSPTQSGADSNPDCNGVSSGSGTCSYVLYTPTYKICASGGSGVCSNTTNTIDCVTTTYEGGTCNGSGGCHLANPSTTTPPTTNIVTQISLTPCG